MIQDKIRRQSCQGKYQTCCFQDKIKINVSDVLWDIVNSIKSCLPYFTPGRFLEPGQSFLPCENHKKKTKNKKQESKGLWLMQKAIRERSAWTRWLACYTQVLECGSNWTWLGDLESEIWPGACRPLVESSIKMLESFSRWIGCSSFRTTPRASSWQSGKAHTQKSGESVHSIMTSCAQINKKEKRSHHVNWRKAWWAQEVVSITQMEETWS